MDVEQKRSNENQQVLAVFDGLLPMVCFLSFQQFCVVISCFAYIVMMFLDENFSAVIQLIIKKLSG